MNASQKQITRAAGTVMTLMVLTSLTGLLREMLAARVFGTTAAADAYAFAARYPDLLFNLAAGGALASAFIPTFTGLLVREDRAGAWRLASGVINLLLLVLSLISAVSWLAAPQVVQYILARGLPVGSEKFALTVQLLRILLLTPTIFGLSGLLMGILNAHQNFLFPALAPIFNSLGVMAGILIGGPRWGIYGQAWGAVLGACLHLLVQLPGLRGLPAWQYLPTLQLHNPAVRTVLRLMGPRVFSVAAVQLNFIISSNLTSYMTGGSAAAYNLGFKLFLMPQAVIAQSLAIAALPTFSALVALNKLDEMRASLADTLRAILFLALPATAGLLLLHRPLIQVLFQSRVFDAASTTLVAWALVCLACGLVSHSVVEIFSRAFFALHDTLTPVLVAVGAMLTAVGLNFVCVTLFNALHWPPHGGLGLSLTLATTLEAAGLLWFIRRRLQGLQLKRLWPGLWRTLLATLGMSLAGVGWLLGAASLPAWLELSGGVALGVLVFGLAAYGLGCPEARLLATLALEKLGLKKG